MEHDARLGPLASAQSKTGEAETEKRGEAGSGTRAARVVKLICTLSVAFHNASNDAVLGPRPPPTPVSVSNKLMPVTLSSMPDNVREQF